MCVCVYACFYACIACLYSITFQESLFLFEKQILKSWSEAGSQELPPSVPRGCSGQGWVASSTASQDHKLRGGLEESSRNTNKCQYGMPVLTCQRWTCNATVVGLLVTFNRSKKRQEWRQGVWDPWFASLRREMIIPNLMTETAKMNIIKDNFYFCVSISGRFLNLGLCCHFLPFLPHFLYF